MKVALLGYGKEGQAVEKYFKSHFHAECEVFQDFTHKEIKQKDFSSYDMVFRSPSVPPLNLPNETSITKYFFDHCPCPIIGVTATKGKGTTCSFTKSILDALGEDAYLVGNIGTPAIEVLDELQPTSVVVYEMSSFQLWDLDKSPHVAVIGHLEPDHLNVHKTLKSYLDAKANICKHQSASDYCVYYQSNPDSTKIAQASAAHLVPYPFKLPARLANSITLPGQHNQLNATAAIAAVAAYKSLSPTDFIKQFSSQTRQGLHDFKGLPHRLEFIRKLHGVTYYDDNFSTNPSSTRVAIEAFPRSNLVVIAGGRDKTMNEDLTEIFNILSVPRVKRAILIGESGHELAHRYPHHTFRVASNLRGAVAAAQIEAERLAKLSPLPVVVLMSPSAASFDMFNNVYDRGRQFQSIVKALS